MRTALFHLFTSTDSPAAVIQQDYYALGNFSYFGESAYEMAGWPATSVVHRPLYARLLAIKRDVDPSSLFHCRHCVGDDTAA